MTYLDEAYRRMKLPIKVRFDDPAWEIGAALDYFPWVYLVEQYDVKSATAQYLHCVNELGGM